jgi:uncharacterized protein YejL (UPF0352 family)
MLPNLGNIDGIKLSSELGVLIKNLIVASLVKSKNRRSFMLQKYAKSLQAIINN